MSNTRRATGAAAQLRAQAIFDSTADIPVVIREQPFAFRPIKDWDIDAMADLDDALSGDARKFKSWAEGCLVDPTAWATVRPRWGELQTIFEQLDELTGGELGKLGRLSA